MIDIRLAIGGIAALLAVWIAYRERNRGPNILPPPSKACERNSVECL